MLDQKELENPKAIEQHIVEKIRASEFVEFDVLQADIFFRIASVPNPIVEFEELEKTFEFKIIQSQLSGFQYTIKDYKVYLFLMIIVDTPGKTILILLYLQWFCKKHNLDEITFDTIIRPDLFGMGIPSKEVLSEIWKGQKVNCTGKFKISKVVNLVNYAQSAGISLFKKKKSWNG